MITLSDINDKIIADYLTEQSYSLYSVRIKALLKAYGGYKGLIDVWYQIKDNVTAYIVRYGGEFIADLLPGADVEEIINLCKMAGGTALLCSPVCFYSATVPSLRRFHMKILWQILATVCVRIRQCLWAVILTADS